MEVRPGYKQTEVGVIPWDWECQKLEEYFSLISYGFTNPMPTAEHGIYMVTAADITRGRIQLETARKTTDAAYRTLLTAKSKPKKSDILLTKDGSLGRLALVGDETLCINQSVAVIRPNERVEPNFLKLLLESPRYQKRMLEDAGGSTIKHIYITIVNLMHVGLPADRAEQRAIAAALSDVDALLGGLDRLIAKKRDLKQAAMQQLLTGQTRLPGFHGEWEVKRLGGIFEITSSKRVFQSEWRSAGIPFYRARELAVLGEVGHVDNELFITRELYEMHRRAYGVPAVGDMLVTGVGTLGKVYVVSDDREFYFKDGNIIWFQIGGRISAEFLRQLYLMPAVTRQIAEGAAGTTVGTYTIAAAKRTIVPVPPLPEQTAIAAVLSDMDAELSALYARRDKTRALKQAMMQELLTGRTRLVPTGGAHA